MNDRAVLRLLSRPQTRASAIRGLRKLATQTVKYEQSEASSHIKTIACRHGDLGVRLMYAAYDAANRDLGNGWRHRYERAAQWIETTYRRRFLELPAVRIGSRASVSQGHRSVAP